MPDTDSRRYQRKNESAGNFRNIVIGIFNRNRYSTLKRFDHLSSLERMFFGLSTSHDRTARSGRDRGPPGCSGWSGALEYEPTPYEVVHEENKLQLRNYGPSTGTSQDLPVVLAPAFVNTPAILDLDSERSVVRRFLERGFEVYVVDWGDPSALDAALSLDDYVARYLHACVKYARRRADGDGVHLFGFSTAAPLAAAYTALESNGITTLCLQGPPLDFSAEGGIFDLRPVVEALNLQRFVATVGNVPAPLYDVGLGAGRPATMSVDLPIRSVGSLDDPEAIVRAGRVARWMAGGPDVPGALFREFFEALYEDNRLIRNELVVDGRRVDFDDVTASVALILGAGDSYVPRDASLPFLEVVGSDDTRVFEMPTDHVGTFVHPVAHETYWPRICDWIADRA